MKNIIVTGAAGFIGSNFIHLALKENWFDKILAIDKLTYASNVNNIPKEPNVEFKHKDIAHITRDELEEFGTIINFAAESHVDRSINGSMVFSENNYLSVHKLLDTIQKHDVDTKLLHISTDEVYGSINEGSFSEKDKLNPRNPYSASKAAAEMIINGYFETYGLKSIITRSSNNYGPRQHTEKLLPKMITKFLQNKPIGIYGNGQQVRDWTFVFDNCRGLKLVLEKGKIGEVYNISAQEERTNLNLVDKVAKLMNIDFEYMEFIEDRIGHDFRYSISNEKIQNLGWKPMVDLDDGLEKTINWYEKRYKDYTRV